MRIGILSGKIGNAAGTVMKVRRTLRFDRGFANDRNRRIVLKKSVFDGIGESSGRAVMTPDEGFPAHIAGIGADSGISLASLRRF